MRCSGSLQAYVGAGGAAPTVAPFFGDTHHWSNLDVYKVYISAVYQVYTAATFVESTKSIMRKLCCG